MLDRHDHNTQAGTSRDHIQEMNTETGRWKIDHINRQVTSRNEGLAQLLLKPGLLRVFQNPEITTQIVDGLHPPPFVAEATTTKDTRYSKKA